MSFRKERRVGIVLELAEQEREILRSVLGQVTELLEHPTEPTWVDGAAGEPGSAADLAAMVGIGTSTSLPADPALARLFPDAYPDDPDAAGDFRRYTEDTLRRRKVAAAATALATLDEPAPVRLEQAAALAWLAALNDLRLVLGVRLDVGEDDDPRTWAESEDAPSYALYGWLTMLQGDLIEALG
jgi:hypothetical protein